MEFPFDTNSLYPPEENHPVFVLYGKHIEREFDTRPKLYKMLGTNILSLPIPSRPSGDAPCKIKCAYIPHL